MAGCCFWTNRAEQGTNNKKELQKALQHLLRVLNRVDDVVIFNSLGKKEIDKIIDLELKGLFDRVSALGYKISISSSARNFIAEKGFDINYGVRPLKRAIQKYLEDPMAEVIIKANVDQGDLITVGFDSKKSEIKIKVRKSPPNSKQETALENS